MDRMVAKGLLTAVKTGKVTHYRSGITREQAQRSELLYALKHAFNNALSPMVQFLLDTGELSAAELDTLESMIKSKRKGKRKAGR
jgi:predicted transcriptional regulator